MRKILVLSDAELGAGGGLLDEEEGIGGGNANQFCMELMGAAANPETTIVDIYVSTHGGSVFDMMQIRGVIQGVLPYADVNVIAMGKVMSAGFYLIAGAPEGVGRYCLPGTTFMWHEANIGVHEGMRNVRNYVDYIGGEMEARVRNDILGRSKIAPRTYDKKFTGDDVFFDDRIALKYGFVDSVLTTLNLDKTFPIEVEADEDEDDFEFEMEVEGPDVS